MLEKRNLLNGEIWVFMRPHNVCCSLDDNAECFSDFFTVRSPESTVVPGM